MQGGPACSRRRPLAAPTGRFIHQPGSAVASGRGVAAGPRVRRALRSRFVLLGVEALAAVPVAPAAVLLGRLLGLVGLRLGRVDRVGRAVGRLLVVALTEAELAAAGARVVAEERARGERLLGRRERAAELALGGAHVGAPDLRRERAAVDVAAVVEAVHLRAVVG